jgi:hypothetical protein
MHFKFKQYNISVRLCTVEDGDATSCRFNQLLIKSWRYYYVGRACSLAFSPMGKHQLLVGRAGVSAYYGVPTRKIKNISSKLTGRRPFSFGISDPLTLD